MARPRTSNSSTTRKRQSSRHDSRAASREAYVTVALKQVVGFQERRSGIPQEIASAILEGFDKHYRLFRQAAIQAKALYERAAWGEMRALSRSRIQMYDRRVEEAVRSLVDRFPDAEIDESL